MTTATPVRPSVSPALARPPAPPAAAGAAPAAVDPLRLLRKHWLTLLLAALIGAAVGTGAHFLFRAYLPVFRAQATFACSGATFEVGQPTQDDEDELQRFMATQVAQMLSDRVLFEAARDLGQGNTAPKWANRFRALGTFDAYEAMTDLRDRLAARVQPGTNLVTLGMGWRDAPEVKAIVEAVRRQFERDARNLATSNTGSQRSALSKSIDELRASIARVTQLRDQELEQGKFDSLEDRASEVRYNIQVVHQKLIQAKLDLTAVTVQLEDRERDMRSETGTPTYPDTLRQEVEADRTVMELTRLINGQKAELQRMRELGLGEAHRDLQRVKASIVGLEGQMKQEKERLLREKFNALLDSLRTSKAQLTAQANEQAAELATLQTRLQDLVQRQAKVNDYEKSLELWNEQLMDYEGRLKQLNTVAVIGNTGDDPNRITDRILLVQAEKVPQEVSFPKIYIMIPAGVLLALMLTGGVTFLREMLDQRIKGPSDVALLPRTRLLGLVPHASEDPARPANVARAFTEQPRGVVAESFRQLRAVVLQRMRNNGHRSLLVVSAMPGSGAGTVVANLGAAMAAADERVLIIDANFRRPSQHKVFKLADAPGLGEVLAGQASLEEAARETGVPNLSVLTCGAAPTRLFERLATERMTAIIAEAASKFDLVLVDAAPAIVSGDARALADRCDASALVVRAFAEKRGMVARLRNELADQRAEFFGLIINAARSSAGGYFKRNIRATHRYQNVTED